PPSSASRQPLTDAERAALDEPTRLVKPPPIPPTQGVGSRSAWLVPVTAGGGLLGLLVLGLLLLLATRPSTTTTPPTPAFPAQANATDQFPAPAEKKGGPFPEE